MANQAAGGTLTVEVVLHAELARHTPDRSGAVSLSLPRGATVADALAHFSLPPRPRVIVGLNGNATSADTVLNDGDRLDLLTPMAGG